MIASCSCFHIVLVGAECCPLVLAGSVSGQAACGVETALPKVLTFRLDFLGISMLLSDQGNLNLVRMSRTHPRKNCLAIMLLCMSALTSCGQKAVLQAELDQLKVALGEHRQRVSELQAQSAALGNLGEYQQATMEHADRLNLRIRELRFQAETLLATKDLESRQLELIQKQTSEYRQRYLE